MTPKTFFVTNAYMTPHNAEVEAFRGTEDPGYLRYQLGKLMILKLREDVRKSRARNSTSANSTMLSARGRDADPTDSSRDAWQRRPLALTI